MEGRPDRVLEDRDGFWFEAESRNKRNMEGKVYDKGKMECICFNKSVLIVKWYNQVLFVFVSSIPTHGWKSSLESK